jgi:hypothetical protein
MERVGRQNLQKQNNLNIRINVGKSCVLSAVTFTSETIADITVFTFTSMSSLSGFMERVGTARAHCQIYQGSEQSCILYWVVSFLTL